MSDKPMNKHSETDWDRIGAMTDDEIDTSDLPALTDTFFKRARIRMSKHPLTIQVDSDVLDWFTAQGDDYERRINAALRIYAEAHKAA
jgi:uncharacterized protein (DUF4415 family)